MGQTSQRSTAQICQRTRAASLVFLGFSFPFFLTLPSPTQEASPRIFIERVKTASHSLLKAKVEMSCRGSGVHTGDRCGHRTSVLVSAFFASCGFPPFALSDAFTHKDEHLVWVSGQVAHCRSLPQRNGAELRGKQVRPASTSPVKP